MEVDWSTNLGRYSGGKTFEERVENIKRGIRNKDRDGRQRVTVYNDDGEPLFSDYISVIANKIGVSIDLIRRYVGSGKCYKGKYFFDYEL